jgi:hypothetical protein
LKKNQFQSKPAYVEPRNSHSAKRTSQITKSKVKINAAKPKACSKVTKSNVKLNAAGLYEWEKVVTKAMARIKKPQVLVSFSNDSNDIYIIISINFLIKLLQ